MIRNLSILSTTAPVNCLKGIARGRAAFIVAAGPSLDKNINELRNVKDKSIIIAVDSALKALIAEGMLPDMVVSTDPTQANLTKFHSIPDDILTRIVLVFSPCVYYEIPQLFLGKRFFFSEPGDLNSWFLEMEPAVSQFNKGNSVSHYAFSLARFMNPSQIIFVGLDLAFPIKQAHSKASANTWDLNDDTNFVMVPDIHDGLVPTIPGFRDAITIFEAQIANTIIPCIDATEGGAMIPGTRIMTLKEVIRKYVNDLDAAPIPLIELWKKAKKIDPSRISDKAEWFSASAREIESLSQQGMDTVSTLLEDIVAYGPDHARVIHGINAANRLTDQIDEHSLYIALIKQRLDSVYIAQYRAKFRAERENNKEKRLIIQIAASKEYFARINNTTSILIRSCEN